MAIAAYEHDDDAAPSPVALATGMNPSPASADSIRLRGTHAWTTAEMKKPSTSAHQTSQAISSAFQSPSPVFASTSAMLCSPAPQQAADSAHQLVAEILQLAAGMAARDAVARVVVEEA